MPKNERDTWWVAFAPFNGIALFVTFNRNDAIYRFSSQFSFLRFLRFFMHITMVFGFLCDLCIQLQNAKCNYVESSHILDNPNGITSKWETIHRSSCFSWLTPHHHTVQIDTFATITMTMWFTTLLVSRPHYSWSSPLIYSYVRPKKSCMCGNLINSEHKIKSKTPNRVLLPQNQMRVCCVLWCAQNCYEWPE